MSSFRVSVQAFLQEIQSWGITLTRQSKKLKYYKPTVQNKFKLNSIEIVLTEIQSIQIKYKKIKAKYKQFVSSSQNQTPNFNLQNEKLYSDELLSEYSQLSKSFMDILQKVALIEAQTNDGNPMVDNEEDVENGRKNDKKSQSFAKNNRDKTFLNDTFAFKVNKESKNNSNANKSIFQKRNSYKEKEKTGSKGHDMRHKAPSMVSNNNELSSISFHKPHTNPHKSSKPNIPKNFHLPTKPQEQETNSLWQIRHQLSKITQMMKQMKNEIKFHEHQETTKEINKIENKNRKIASQLKSIKDENRLILSKIEELKQELVEEKKTQVDLINRFEKKAYLSNSDNNNTALYDSRVAHSASSGGDNNNYRSLYVDNPQNNRDKSPITNRKGEQKLESVSDWVRMRI